MEGKRICVYSICKFAGISRSCFYYQQCNTAYKPPGRPAPGYTINRDGTILPDQTIVQVLKQYRSETFFINAGGAKKLAKYLAIEKQIYVNHKKVYRLCNTNHLLLFKQSSNLNRKIKKKRCEYMEISRPNQMWQFDLKYIWIHGESRWCFLLIFIDVVTKKVTGYYLGRTCKSGDLVLTLNEALRKESIGPEQRLIIRSDNGPQMSSNKFIFYLKRLEQKLVHEFIPPRCPDRNAYVEAFNSILEIEVLQVRQFYNFAEVYKTIVEFIEFYNNRRLHGSLGHVSPVMYIKAYNEGLVTPRVISI